MARRDQTLYRDESDKMLGGVCSGLGEYFDIDTNLVRVAFVAVTTFGGGGIVAYLILWAILDPKPMAPPLEAEPQSTAPGIDLVEPTPPAQDLPASSAAGTAAANTETTTAEQTP